MKLVRLTPTRSTSEGVEETSREASRESLALVLEGLLESMADGVIALDFRGEVTHLSDCLRDPSLDQPESPRDPLPEEVLRTLRQHAEQLEAGETARFEFDWEREELGPRRYRAVGAAAASGITLFALHDVTHEEAMARELEHSRNLAAVGQLAATVAHELRNPLAAIQGFTNLLQREVHDRPAALKQTSRILEGVERASHIINDLLTFARPIQLERHATAVEALLTESLMHQKASPRWHERFAIDLLIDPGLPQLPLDRRVILQVLANLYDNAMDAMGEAGGTLSVRARASSDLKPCTRVRMVVRDTGCGLSAEAAARAFEPFYTTKPRGTGLGLALVRRAIEAHGGTVHMVSAPGRGTSVVIDLPVGGIAMGHVRAEGAKRAQEAA